MAVYEIEFTGWIEERKEKREQAKVILGFSGYDPSGWSSPEHSDHYEKWRYDNGRRIGIDSPTIKSLENCGAKVKFIKP